MRRVELREMWLKSKGWWAGVVWVWDGKTGGDGGWGGSAHNKWQFSVWSGWLPNTGSLDCRGVWGGGRWVKTGRMAPVKGQLTDGALTPSNGVWVHTDTHPPIQHSKIMRYKNSYVKWKTEEMNERLNKIKPNKPVSWFHKNAFRDLLTAV